MLAHQCVLRTTLPGSKSLGFYLPGRPGSAFGHPSDASHAGVAGAEEAGHAGNEFVLSLLSHAANVSWAEEAGHAGDDTAHSMLSPVREYQSTIRLRTFQKTYLEVQMFEAWRLPDTNSGKSVFLLF